MKEIDGVISADVSFSAGRAVVTYDSDKTSPEALVSVINERTLYRASLARTRSRMALALEGDVDEAQMSRLTTRLGALGGIANASALPDGRVNVVYDPLRVDITGIVAAVERMGYGVREFGAVQAESRSGWFSRYWPLAALLVLVTLFFLYRRRRARSHVEEFD